MKIAVFRVDAAPYMGIGHLIRCLTFANSLNKHQWHIVFVCSDLENNYYDVLKDTGFELRLLPQATQKNQSEQNKSSTIEDAIPKHSHWLPKSQQEDAIQTLEVTSDLECIDLLIIDHYALDRRWEENFGDRSKVKNIFVIDDLADRAHYCDFLLDQTFGRTKEDYQNLVPYECSLLIGKDYILMREEFLQKRDAALKSRLNNDNAIQNILICFGSGDPQNATSKVLDALEHIEGPFSITVLLSSKAPHIDKIEFYKFNYPHKVEIISDCQNVSDKIKEADIAFGAGGTMAWERCCLGLPSFIVMIADNQNLITKKLEQGGAAISLGRQENLISQNIIDAFKTLISNPQAIKSMARQAAKICDGTGTQRIVDIVERAEALQK